MAVSFRTIGFGMKQRATYSNELNVRLNFSHLIIWVSAWYCPGSTEA